MMNSKRVMLQRKKIHPLEFVKIFLSMTLTNPFQEPIKALAVELKVFALQFKTTKLT
jgi:hypothetical protein